TGNPLVEVVTKSVRLRHRSFRSDLARSLSQYQSTDPTSASCAVSPVAPLFHDTPSSRLAVPSACRHDLLRWLRRTCREASRHHARRTNRREVGFGHSSARSEGG